MFREGLSRFAAALIPAGLLLLASCRTEQMSVTQVAFPTPGAFSTAQLSPSIPRTMFDRQVPTLVSGEGWSPTQVDPSGRGLDRHQVIAVGELSELFSLVPVPGDLELFLRCRPAADGLDHLPLALEVRIGDGSPQRRELVSGWNDLRMPYRSTRPAGALERIVLEFGPTLPPVMSDRIEHTNRRQWAYCSTAAITPAGFDVISELSRWDGSSLEDDSAGETLDARAENELGLLVPGASEVTFELAATSDSDDCFLQATVVTGDPGPPGPPARIEPFRRLVRATNRSSAPAELRVSIAGETARGCRFDSSTTSLGVLKAAPEKKQRLAKPHVFYYLIDTLRADALEQPFGGREAAPGIRRFASEAVRFENAWAASSWTLPSILSLMTGVLPHRHGVWRLDQRFPPDGAGTLAEHLRDAGYATAGFSQSWIAGPLYGFDRGFDDYFVTEQLNGAELRTTDLLTTLRAWLVGRWSGDEPIFAYVHTVEPHNPYSPRRPDVDLFGGMPSNLRIRVPVEMPTLRQIGKELTEFELERLRALYHAEVAFADRQFTAFLDLLKAAGLYDDSLIILLSDHGEEFREHGGFGHGRNLYEEVARVPLILKFPGGRWGGSTVEAPVSLVDLMPTVLELAGLERPAATRTDGRSLLPLAANVEQNWRKAQITEVVTHRDGPTSVSRFHRGLQLGDVRCIHIAPYEADAELEERWIFLRLDPATRNESALDETAPESVDCRATLSRYETRVAHSGPVAEDQELTKDQVEALRALGYL